MTDKDEEKQRLANIRTEYDAISAKLTQLPSFRFALAGFYLAAVAVIAKEKPDNVHFILLIGLTLVFWSVDLRTRQLLAKISSRGVQIEREYWGYNGWISRVFSDYLFIWDNVPGNDSERLLRFLRDDLCIGWTENAEIRKSEDDKTIQIRKDKNSLEIIHEKRKEATIKICDGTTHDLKAKKENCKLKIYKLDKDTKLFFRKVKLPVFVSHSFGFDLMFLCVIGYSVFQLLTI